VRIHFQYLIVTSLLVMCAMAASAAADLLKFQWVADPPEEFLSRSPVRYSQKIKTPMMFIEGEEDWRTPAWQGGGAMFRALKAQKKTAVMVNFPGENHELSRSGKPSHRVARLQHIVNWFDKYLLGKKVDLYDLQ